MSFRMFPSSQMETLDPRTHTAPFPIPSPAPWQPLTCFPYPWISPLLDIPYSRCPHGIWPLFSVVSVSQPRGFILYHSRASGSFIPSDGWMICRLTHGPQWLCPKTRLWEFGPGGAWVAQPIDHPTVRVAQTMISGSWDPVPGRALRLLQDSLSLCFSSARVHVYPLQNK